MADQDGLRFLFDLNDKITPKLAKITAKVLESRKKIDKAFTRTSKSQETNLAKLAAAKQRHAQVVGKAHSRALEDLKRQSDAEKRAIDKSIADKQKAYDKTTALLKREKDARARATDKSIADQKKAHEKALSLQKRQSDAKQRHITVVEKAHRSAIAFAKRESDARTRASKRSTDAQIRDQARVDKAKKKALEKSLARIKRESAAFKRSMTRLASAASVAFAAVAGKSLQMAGGYDAAMRSVQAKTGATGEVLDKLSAQAREMGRTTVHSATEAARGQAFLAQAGFEANEVLEALPATLALATAGELGLATAADIASNVLSGFRLETSETGRVADVLALAASKTNTSVSQLGAALAKAAPSAAAAKWSLEETTAAIGKLSDAGIQGEEAGTALKTMMARLAVSGGPAERLLKKMGITVKDTTGQMLPLNDILMELAPHANDVGLQMQLLGTRGGNAGLVLGAVAQDARKLTGELENADGAAQRMADIMGGGLWGSIKKIQSIVESAYISFGKRLAPAVKKTANLLAKLPGPIQEVVVVTGSLVGAMGGLMLIMPQSFGALVQFPGKLVTLAKKIKIVTAAQRIFNAVMRANPIGLAVTAVAALAGGLYLLWKRYKRVQKMADASAESTEDLADRYDDLTEKIADATKMLKWEQRTYGYKTRTSAKVLRSLVAERKELERQIRQRSKIVEAMRKETAARQRAWAEQAAEVKKLADARAKAAEKIAAAEKKATAAAEDSAKAVKALTDSWTGATLKTKELLRAFRSLTPEQKKNERIMGQVLDRYHSMRKVIGPFDKALESLWLTTERLNPAIKEQAKVAAAAAKEQAKLKKAADALAESTRTAKIEASGYELALAGMAGQMGGAAGQALNLVIAMREHNKVQRQAVAAGKESAKEFSTMQQTAGGLAFAFAAVGDSMEGTSAKVMSELSTIASAFATGGIAGGIIASAIAVGKALFSLFTKGKKKRKAAAAAAKAEMERIAEVNRKLAEEQERYWDTVYGSIIGVYDRAKAAGIDAHTKVFQAAIKAGDGWTSAVEKAKAAQLAAYEEILIAEGKKFVRMAAFEAALKAIRSGNAAGAAAAAAKAAADTRTAWVTALAAVEDADKVTTAAMMQSSSKLTSATIADARRARVAQVAAANAARVARERAARVRWADYYSGYDEGDGIDVRQHGGPVRAGRPYLVGERGPEMFVPSQTGRIDPNGSSGSGSGVDAKALGRAVADALEGTRVEVDGRKLGRLTVRHQPLAMAELGGRR